MIIVNIKKNSNKEICQIEASGHAEFDEKGKDIVCSAVSAILIGGLNSINNIDNYDILKKEGYLSLKLKENISNTYEDKIVLNTIYIQLKTVENGYKKFIKING